MVLRTQHEIYCLNLLKCTIQHNTLTTGTMLHSGSLKLFHPALHRLYAHRLATPHMPYTLAPSSHRPSLSL